MLVPTDMTLSCIVWSNIQAIIRHASGAANSGGGNVATFVSFDALKKLLRTQTTKTVEDMALPLSQSTIDQLEAKDAKIDELSAMNSDLSQKLSTLVDSENIDQNISAMKTLKIELEQAKAVIAEKNCM